VLGQEPAAAEVHLDPVDLLGPREPADEVLALEHGHAATAPGEVQRCGEAGGTRPQDKCILTPQGHRAYPGAYDLPFVEASAVTTLRPNGGSARRAIDVIGALTRSDLKVRYGRGRLSTIKSLLDPFAAVGDYLLLVAFVFDRLGQAIRLSIASAVVPFQLE